MSYNNPNDFLHFYKKGGYNFGSSGKPLPQSAKEAQKAALDDGQTTNVDEIDHIAGVEVDENHFLMDKLLR